MAKFNVMSNEVFHNLLVNGIIIQGGMLEKSIYMERKQYLLLKIIEGENMGVDVPHELYDEYQGIVQERFDYSEKIPYLCLKPQPIQFN